MENITYILICHFGLEKVLKSEVKKLGLTLLEGTDGEVKAIGSITDIPRLNLNLRTCERVMIEVANFKATTFEELFQGVKNARVEDFVPMDGAFPITKANQDKNSIIHSSMSIQSITKKAMVERLREKYKTVLLSEDKGKYPFRVKFNKNIASLRLDTTGDSLHKRGYRIKAGLAPIEETLAAALIKLVLMEKQIKARDMVLVDPFCGSGTIPIEAAMMSLNMPVSIDRAFVSETWNKLYSDNGLDRKKVWNDAMNEAKENIFKDRMSLRDIRFFGYDIDENMIRISKENAERAGVAKYISFEKRVVKNLAEAECFKKYDNGIILCNPPYGERLEDKETIIPIYEDLKNAYAKIEGFDLNFITSFEDAPKILGKETKNRKLYNGMIKTYLYNYAAK